MDELLGAKLHCAMRSKDKKQFVAWEHWSSHRILYALKGTHSYDCVGMDKTMAQLKRIIVDCKKYFPRAQIYIYNVLIIKYWRSQSLGMNVLKPIINIQIFYLMKAMVLAIWFDVGDLNIAMHTKL